MSPPSRLSPRLTHSYILSASKNQIHALQSHLNTNPSLLNAIGSLNRTALHWACSENAMKCIEELLSRGIDTTIRTSWSGDTALHICAHKGHLEALKMILDVNASLLEVRDGEGCTPLIRASRKGHMDCVRELLNRGAQVMAMAAFQRTALHHACFNGHVDVVKELLRAKADAHAVDDEKLTPLDWALDSSEFRGDVIELLRKWDSCG